MSGANDQHGNFRDIFHAQLSQVQSHGASKHEWSRAYTWRFRLRLMCLQGKVVVLFWRPGVQQDPLVALVQWADDHV